MLFSNLSISLVRTAMSSFFQTNKIKIVLVVIVLGVLAWSTYQVQDFINDAKNNATELGALKERYNTILSESADKTKQVEQLQKSIDTMSTVLIQLRETNEALKETYAQAKIAESSSIAVIKKHALEEAKKNNPQAVASGDVYAGTAAKVASTDQKISTVRIETITKLYCSMEVEAAAIDSKCPKN